MDMRTIKNSWLFAGIMLLPFFGSAQKRLGDLTLVYNSTITNAQDSSRKINSTTSFFVKGNLSRSEVTSNLFSSITIYDSKSGSGVLLKEVNGQKLLIRMNEENWNQKNKRYSNLSFTKTNETKTIAGYFCNQAKASTADGFDITVFYTRDLLPENKISRGTCILNTPWYL
jgi:GLPGLI family protein